MNNKKEFLSEENYERGKKKIKTIALIILIVGVLIGGSLIVTGLMKQGKINSKYSEDNKTNLSQQLVQSCAKAIAVALDKALLYGDGIPGDPDHGHKIKGLMTYAGINKANHQVVNDTIDYDPILKAFGPIKKANLMPTDVALSTNVGLALAGYKTADGMYIDGPKVLNQYEITESNNMNDEHILAYDRNQLLLGIHKDITIEFGYSADMFQRIQKGLRIYLRTDLGLINEKAVSQITLQR